MPQSRSLRAVVALAFLAGVAGCASPQAGDEFADPYEDLNRTFHAANVRLDRNVLRPLAQGYDTVTPELVQHLIGNGLDFLEQPQNLANYLLQGDVDASLRVLGRVLVNGTLGLGLLDPATEFGLPSESTDFGITLGKWGVDEGVYLVLPFVGPTTVRDLGGTVVDRGFSPTTYVGIFTEADFIGYAVTGTGLLDGRNRNADLIDEVLYNSPDSYVTQRSIYLQRRRALIRGESTEDSLPDIFEDTPAPVTQ